MLRINNSWSDLVYWNTGEWQVIEERLDDHEKDGVAYVPSRNLLFRSLDRVPPEEVRCVICGQDPYPSTDRRSRRQYATGVAFSIPSDVTEYPPTLINLFKEYRDDLHYPAPKNGDLTKWCERGVLLWNVFPSCALGKPGSHHWDEWSFLTKEIVEKLDDGTRVYVLLGGEARKYSEFIKNSPVIETSHPSPLGAKHGFLGSRIFSKVNIELCKLSKEPINWRLPDGESKS